MDSYRLKRVSNLLRSRISDMILKHEIKDPRVTTMISISNIEVSKDLSYAKIYVSSYESGDSLSAAVEGLNHASGFIQSTVGKRIKLRLMPKLNFVVDHAIEEGFRVNEKIKEVMS